MSIEFTDDLKRPSYEYIVGLLESITGSFNMTRLIMHDQQSRDDAGEIVAEARRVISLAKKGKP